MLNGFLTKLGPRTRGSDCLGIPNSHPGDFFLCVKLKNLQNGDISGIRIGNAKKNSENLGIFEAIKYPKILNQNLKTISYPRDEDRVFLR